eukprot:9277654-Pyramimonas_sp.AAC.2
MTSTLWCGLILAEPQRRVIGSTRNVATTNSRNDSLRRRAGKYLRTPRLVRLTSKPSVKRVL